MRVTVTGGAGFVGSAIVRRLIACGHHVRVVDDYSRGLAANLEGVNCDNHAVDAGDADYTHCDAVVHAAAYPDVSQNWTRPEERTQQWERNANLTRRVLDRLPDRCPFILLSTCSVYGPGRVHEHSPPYATSPYAATKLAAEALLSAYHEAHRVQGTTLRLVNVVGPRYGHGHLKDFVQAAKEGRIHALDDGWKRKPFVHVLDVADVVARHLDEMCCDVLRVQNVTSETVWSWLDSVEVMRTMRPERPFELSWEDRPSGWVGDPDHLAVRSLSGDYGKRSIVAGVRDALEGLGW